MSQDTPRSRKILRAVLLTPVALVALVAAGLALSHEPRPVLEPTPEADAVAREVMAKVDVEAWKRIGAVSWSFRGKHHHLWDRRRSLARVAWDDVEVLVDLNKRDGIAWRGGVEVLNPEAEALVARAYAHWINDSFWLNPIAKFFDDGTTRALTTDEEGRRALLVSYSGGGLTPGDAYLWSLDQDGMPVRWKLWVKILPIGGVAISWEDWVTLPTGAKVSARHATPIGDLKMGEIRGAESLQELVGEDPFCPLPSVPCRTADPAIP